jgi:hypothetical protein
MVLACTSGFLADIRHDNRIYITIPIFFICRVFYVGDMFMTIKIKFNADTAVIRWRTPMEKEYIKRQMTMFRDAVEQQIHILLKNEEGREIPRLPKIVPKAGVLPNGVNLPDKTEVEITGGIHKDVDEKKVISIKDEVTL